MTNGTRVGRLVAALLALTVAAALAACGSSSDSSGSTSTTDGGASAAGSGVAAAQADMAAFIGQPSAFPVTEKLKTMPRGATIAYMDCGSPYCALFNQLLQPAAKLMGVKLDRIVTGSAANSVNAAFDTVITKKPAAVIVAGSSIQLWANKLKALQAAKIPVVTTGVTGAEAQGVDAPQAAEAWADETGRLLADYVVAKLGTTSNTVYYSVPELPFTLLSAKSYQAQLAKLCPGCAVRVVPIPVATIGTTAPQAVVSDLQAHPKTTVAVFSTDEAQTGLPSALKAAGITRVKTIGSGPTPTNLQYVKAGTQTATLGFDTAVGAFELLDQAARAIAGQPLSGPAAKGLPVLQFLTQADITFDPSHGWTGYPDFAKRFATLWGVG